MTAQLVIMHSKDATDAIGSLEFDNSNIGEYSFQSCAGLLREVLAN